MTAPNPDTHACAAAVYEWLVDREAGDLPRATEIGHLVAPRLSFEPDGSRVHQALKWLQGQNMIAHDSRRGHLAIRLPLHGKTFKTAGCPFEPPADKPLAG